MQSLYLFTHTILDGVGPRAKSNQQRSRRYVSSLEKSNSSSTFDSNQISPGTIFMNEANIWTKMYIEENIKSNSTWKSLKVVLSDSSIPGEGEHKIMDFIRLQKSLSSNIRHCIYGADSDLFVLALSVHEEKFTILREENVFNNRYKTNSVILRNMSKDISEVDIKNIFETFGKVKSVEMREKKHCNHFIITFEELRPAQVALNSTIRFDHKFFIRHNFIQNTLLNQRRQFTP